MPFRLKISLAILAVLIITFGVVPLFIDPGEPPGVRPLAEVAGPSAEYLSVEGIDLHVVRYEHAPGANDAGEPSGPGPERLFLLLHGFPFSTATFAELGPRLAALGDVVAVDLPGFGLSERPLDEELDGGFNPYSAAGQLALVRELLATLRAAEPATSETFVVGADSGARLALDVALAEQNSAEDRLTGLVLIGASPYTSSDRSWFSRAIMNTPHLQRLGPVFLRQIAQEPGLRILRAGWADPSAITQEELDAYQQPWTVEDWDDALWELTKAAAPPSLEGELWSLSLPTLVVAGAEDSVVPTDVAQRLAGELPDASLELVPGCGHAVQEECPDALTELIGSWLGAATSTEAGVGSSATAGAVATGSTAP